MYEEENEEIARQYDRGVEARLGDLHMNAEYMKAPSCVGVVERIRGLADRLGVKEGSREYRDMVRTVMPMAVPAGTKAAVRGNAFNRYIRGLLGREMEALGGRWVLEFEAKRPEVSEIADWVLRERGGRGRVVIGFNQLDMWGGGAQVNRAAKYIMDDAMHRRLCKQGVMLVCVVARKVVLRGQGKVSRILARGVRTGRLVWPRGLKALVRKLS